jgi:hypothetical protein
MDKYILKTKKGEVITITNQENLESAIEFFSFKKKLSPEQLLSIYKVERDENRDKY